MDVGGGDNDVSAPAEVSDVSDVSVVSVVSVIVVGAAPSPAAAPGTEVVHPASAHNRNTAATHRMTASSHDRDRPRGVLRQRRP